MSRYPQAQKWELNSWYLLQVGWATNIGTMNQTPVPWKRKYTPARGHISRLLLLFTALLLLDPWALKLLLTQWTWIRFSQFGSAPFFFLLLIPSSFCYFFLIFSFPSILFLNSFILFPFSSFILENLTYKAQNQMCLHIQEEMYIKDEVQRLNSSKGDILQ